MDSLKSCAGGAVLASPGQSNHERDERRRQKANHSLEIDYLFKL
jgi:hypothetical protein